MAKKDIPKRKKTLNTRENQILISFDYNYKF